ncbi:MAG: asparagine synthase B [Oligoflexia bacterium]|nr:asparagine synthase B [Oligoflexia bacterium]
MCGILAVIGKCSEEEVVKIKEVSKKLSPRGPDESGSFVSDHSVLCHERLSIIDLHSGKQPLLSEDMALIHNGEIYNHMSLRGQLGHELFKTKSDSESILFGYKKWGEEVVHKLDGVFAFVLTHEKGFLVGRDPIGVKPLFYGRDEKGRLWFASEYKALIDSCVDIHEFLPGHVMTEKDYSPRRWFFPDWFRGVEVKTGPEKIKQGLIDAVEKRLMSDVSIAALLSGGLDSSLVASIAAKALAKEGKKLYTYSVGLEGSPDLEKARDVAAFIGSVHTEVVYTVEEGLDHVVELIEKIESYDVTTIRASTPMSLVAQRIRKDGHKVILSGEGADELYGGYLYFAHAPSASDFHFECLRRVKRLHTSDVLRADRSSAGNSLEARVPFLDLEFLKISMELDAEYKVITDERREKYVLRKAFDDGEYLPSEVLWRQKEQFSDGVGYSWVDGLKKLADEKVSDVDFAKAAETFPHNTPLTKEAYFYRKIYASHFDHDSVDKLVKRWIPKWQEYNIDPSGRANKLHEQTVELVGDKSEDLDKTSLAVKADLVASL